MFNKQFGALDRFMSLKRLSSQGFQAPVVTSRSNIASTVWGNVIRSKLTNTGLGEKKKREGGGVQKNLTKKIPKHSCLTGLSWSVHTSQVGFIIVTVHVNSRYNSKSMPPKKSNSAGMQKSFGNLF